MDFFYIKVCKQVHCHEGFQLEVQIINQSFPDLVIVAQVVIKGVKPIVV